MTSSLIRCPLPLATQTKPFASSVDFKRMAFAARTARGSKYVRPIVATLQHLIHPSSVSRPDPVCLLATNYTAHELTPQRLAALST